MWARYVPFYLCQRMRPLRQQQFLTLSQNKKKVVSDFPEVHLNVSKYRFLNFHFFHWFKLDLVKMAKLACDLLCQRMRRMRQHFASVCAAYASKLLAQTAHTLAKSCKNEFLQAYAAHAVANCQRMRRMRQHFASVCGACGSNLLAQTAHTLANCQRMRRIRQHFASVDGACGSTLRAYEEHAVANCQHRRRIWQQFASVCGACGSNLLAQTAHTVAI